MEILELTKHVREKAMGRKRFIVAIAGPPASGKSTMAKNLCEALLGFSVPTKVIPMDGFHLDNSLLTEMGLLSRKGSPATFDAAGFCHLIGRLSLGNEDVFIPTFDRERDISIACSQRISTDDAVLVVEGNYLLLESEPWVSLTEFWDETIFLRPDLKIIENRLVDRWLSHGLSHDDAKKRAHENDLPNARVVLKNSSQANFEIVVLPAKN